MGYAVFLTPLVLRCSWKCTSCVGYPSKRNGGRLTAFFADTVPIFRRSHNLGQIFFLQPLRQAHPQSIVLYHQGISYSLRNLFFNKHKPKFLVTHPHTTHLQNNDTSILFTFFVDFVNAFRQYQNQKSQEVAIWQKEIAAERNKSPCRRASFSCKLYRGLRFPWLCCGCCSSEQPIPFDYPL